MPKPIEPVRDEDLAFSMFVFMTNHGGDRMLRATAKACQMKIEEAEADDNKDGKNAWTEAKELVTNAADIITNGDPNKG